MALTNFSEKNLRVIENFILHYTHGDAHPLYDVLMQSAREYIEEDHVDGEGSEEALAEKETQKETNELLVAVDLVLGHPLALEKFQSKFGILGEQTKIFIRHKLIKVGAKKLLLSLANTIRDENEILNK